MLQELKFQLSTAILTILTVAAAISAGINFYEQVNVQRRLPDDGVTWVDRATPGGAASVVEARRVVPDSGADNAGIRNGDILLKINVLKIEKALFVPQALASISVWNKADYLVEQRGVQFKTSVIVAAGTRRDPFVTYQYLLGLGYLVIGLFVYFRRGSAQKALHFYVFCLVSFISYAFHYTGGLNGFDEVILFGNLTAGLFAPTLFLHFCLTFPEPRPWIRNKWRVALLYLPATLLMVVYIGFSSGILRVSAPLIEVRESLDRAWILFLTAMYLTGVAALTARAQAHAKTRSCASSRKWLRNAARFTASCRLPFSTFCRTSWASRRTRYMKFSVASLALIPLTLAYAIVRYRLMDVDILFRRGYAYTLATVCVFAGGLLRNRLLASPLAAQKNFKDLGTSGLVAVMLMAAFLFQPVRNWIQERLDRHFYRDRYDYRHTLVEFARELSSETDLDAMLSVVAERLRQTLNIRHLAFFLSDENSEEAAPRFYLKMGSGLTDRHGKTIAPADPLGLTFLDQSVLPPPDGSPVPPYLFFGRTRYLVDAVSRAMPASERQTISDLDLTYYLPCAVRGRTIAFLGVSRTEDGDFLSSVDVELLVTLSGYVGIAIENARLYRSLQRKVEENERLKEFSENIVGVDQRRHPCRRPGRPRGLEHAGRTANRYPARHRRRPHARRIASANLMEQFTRVRGENGIHHIYKFILRPAALPLGRHGERKQQEWICVRPQESTLNIAIAPLISKNMEQIPAG